MSPSVSLTQSIYSRTTSIKGVLSRNVFNITQEVETSLVDELQVPQAWIAEAKAILSQYDRQPFDAYLHYLQARQPQLAHDVAMNELAIEAILRDDLALLGSLFRLFNPSEISDWAYRGKVRLPHLLLVCCRI